MFNRFWKYLCFFLMPFYSLLAQETAFKYAQNLTITDGLAHNGVTSIFEDSRGYIWISTYDGLNRYNGFEFKIFKNTVNDEIFETNRIRTISEDKNGNLWLGTDEGIAIYHYSTEKFSTLYSYKQQKTHFSSGPIVRKILFNDKKGIVICATEGNGILLFKNDYTFIEQCTPQFDVPSSDILFIDGLALDESNYLFSTSIGMVLFNIDTKQFNWVVKNHISESKSLIKLDERTLCITGLNGVSLVNYSAANGTIKLDWQKNLWAEKEYVAAALDAQNNLWLGLKNTGIVRIDNVQSFMAGKDFSKSVNKLSPSIVRMSCIVALKSGTWVGTFNKGIYRFKSKENPFKGFTSHSKLIQGVPSNEILSIAPIDNTRIYVSTNQSNFGLYNTQTHEFESPPANFSESDKTNMGYMFVDSKGNKWFNIRDKGIIRIKKGSDESETVRLSNAQPLKIIAVRSMTEDVEGNIWVGFREGIYKISIDLNGQIKSVEDFNQNTYFKDKKRPNTRVVYPDPNGRWVWIGTEADGLYRIECAPNVALKDLKVTNFRHDKNEKSSLSSNFVSALLRTPKGDLWIGTEGGGICKVLDETTSPKFVSYSDKQGLSNNVVKTMLYNGDNSLWIATNIGLNRFNLDELKFTKFGLADGLPFEDFNYAAKKLNNGYFVFSGLDGLCYFNPNELLNSEPLPKLELGEFKILNTLIKPGDTFNDRVVLEKRLNELPVLHLDYDENVFSIGINSLHYSPQNNHFIRYMLTPNTSEWIELPIDQRFIYVNGLPPGKYILKVQASNSLHEWTEAKELTIIISPPFWKTWQAYVFYTLLFLGALYAAFRFSLRIQALNHRFEIEQLEKNNIKEINDAKLRFFGNISHEIKTPLTLISGPIQQLLTKFRHHGEIGDKLELINRQSQKMLHLIEQVHDFQKADANLLKMNSSGFDFEAFIKEIYMDYAFMAKTESKKLLLKHDANEEIYVYADKDKIEKILNNILTNAFKHTDKNDTIEISYYTDKKDVIIKIKDSGSGINAADLPRIFDRFYQSEQKQDIYYGGAGIGLAFAKQLVDMHYGHITAESELTSGTTFTITLPIVSDKTSADERGIEQKILDAEKKLEKNEFTFDLSTTKDIVTNKTFSGSKIFIAEDNPDLRAFITDVLSPYYSVKSFENGQECLDAMEKEWPDIVISDVLMPVMNGFELCAAIKLDIKTSHIPVILLTAFQGVENQITGLKNGADAYINKPFNIPHLIASIEAQLNNRKQLRERFQIELPLELEDSQGQNDNIFLEKLYKLMADNLNNSELELDSFAKDLYLNRTHFYQKVKSITNYTPFELLKNYRLKKAAELLLQDKYSVNDVYLMTGFKSRTHFSKLFKEKYDLTPGNYAQEILKKYEK